MNKYDLHARLYLMALERTKIRTSMSSRKNLEEALKWADKAFDVYRAPNLKTDLDGIGLNLRAPHTQGQVFVTSTGGENDRIKEQFEAIKDRLGSQRPMWWHHNPFGDEPPMTNTPPPMNPQHQAEMEAAAEMYSKAPVQEELKIFNITGVPDAFTLNTFYSHVSQGQIRRVSINVVAKDLGEAIQRVSGFMELPIHLSNEVSHVPAGELMVRYNGVMLDELKSEFKLPLQHIRDRMGSSNDSLEDASKDIQAFDVYIDHDKGPNYSRTYLGHIEADSFLKACEAVADTRYPAWRYSDDNDKPCVSVDGKTKYFHQTAY